MSRVQKGRYTASPPNGSVVFIIGMFGTVEAGKVGHSAAHRMDPAVPDDPAVPVPS